MARNLVTRPLVELFEEQTWWRDLNSDERDAVRSETKELSRAMLSYGHSKMAIGQHLERVQKVLEPRRAFLKYLKTLNFSERTAYRYINGYSNASKQLPEHVLNAAMQRGFNMIGETEAAPLGIYTEAVKKLPPPKSKNPEKISSWLDEVKQVVKVHRVRKPANEELLLKSAFRTADAKMKHLPADVKTRTRWVRELAGMLLYSAGGTKKVVVSPASPPEGYKAVRGRPRLNPRAA